MLDTVRDEVVKTIGRVRRRAAGSRHHARRPLPVSSLFVRLVTGRSSTREKEEIVEYIHTLGIGHNTLISPDGKMAHLLPDRRRPRPLEASLARAARARSPRK